MEVVPNYGYIGIRTISRSSCNLCSSHRYKGIKTISSCNLCSRHMYIVQSVVYICV